MCTRITVDSPIHVLNLLFHGYMLYAHKHLKNLGNFRNLVSWQYLDTAKAALYKKEAIHN